MIIKIHRITKPDRWYSQLLKQTFTAEPSLFGYIITQGEYTGKLIHRRDAGEFSIPQPRISTVEPPKRIERVKPTPAIKTPEKVTQTAEVTLLRSKHYERTLEMERARLIEKQIREYAKQKRDRRANHG